MMMMMIIGGGHIVGQLNKLIINVVITNVCSDLLSVLSIFVAYVSNGERLLLSNATRGELNRWVYGEVMLMETGERRRKN